MKKINFIIDAILFAIVFIVLISAIGSSLYNKPIIFSTVKSNSMYPLFQRGDMIVLKNVTKDDIVNIGDIIVFKAQEGSLKNKGFVVHRLIEIDNNNFITQGDANEYNDPPNKREWIVSKVITVGDRVVKIPYAGYITLWMDSFQKNPYAMPIITIILAGILGISELKHKKKEKKKGIDLQLIYIFSGLTISVVMAATMVATSQHIKIPYEITLNNEGASFGNSFGIVKLGNELQLPLAELNNNGFFTVTATVTSKDKQITFSHNLVELDNKTKLSVEANLKATKIGKFNSIVHIGLFYPFLPKALIYSFASKSYWLALFIISLIPGLPLILYPLIDKKMRKNIKKEIRRNIRRIHNIFIFN